MSKIELKTPKIRGDWYAVQVLPNNETKICDLFREKLGIFSKVPCQKIWKRQNGKKIVRTKPLLSNYVFILSELESINWRLFYSVGGVFGLVKRSGKPAAIPNEQISSLEKLCSYEKPVHEIDYSKLKQNERVEVVDGPLKGAIGNYLKISEKSGKFIVKLDFFKRALVMELEEGYIKPF